MKFLVFAVLFCLSITMVYCATKRCSYDYCVKEELGACFKAKDRAECNRKGGLYVTYSEGTLSFNKHTCCPWKMNEINQKSLYCVRNVRSTDQLCTSEKLEKYRIKFQTKGECSKISCN